MLTAPDALPKWWGPMGFAMPEIALELRVGGRYCFGMKPPEGDLFHITGEYLETQAPTRLVFTFEYDEPDPDDQETVVTITLQPVDGATEVSLSQGQFLTEGRLDLHASGWTDSFTRMRELLPSG
jgi:uncharacterized protein YndB with AHSA1/START domain